MSAMNRESLLFCSGALAASLLVAVIGFRYAALPRATLDACEVPTRPERMPDIDLGRGFGKVSVIDLVGYYLDHPPAPPVPGSAPAAVRRFGGC